MIVEHEEFLDHKKEKIRGKPHPPVFIPRR
jgi:hypothetical protein